MAVRIYAFAATTFNTIWGVFIMPIYMKDVWFYPSKFQLYPSNVALNSRFIKDDWHFLKSLLVEVLNAVT